MVRTDNQHVTAVILAGGQGKRMQEADKGLLELAGKPLVQHISERIAPHVREILINCNRNQAEYARLGYTTYSDAIAGYPGPLAGLYSVLQHSDSALFLFIPCDMPLLPDNLISRMLETMQQAGADLCTVNDGSHIHPVVLLVKREVLSSLKHALADGQYKVRQWLFAQKHVVADFSDNPQAFLNVNTPEELAQLETKLNEAN